MIFHHLSPHHLINQVNLLIITLNNLEEMMHSMLLALSQLQKKVFAHFTEEVHVGMEYLGKTVPKNIPNPVGSSYNMGSKVQMDVPKVANVISSTPTCVHHH